MKCTWDRRQFGMMLACTAVMPGGVALAQQSPKGLRRIGLMMAVSDNDPEGLKRVDAFRKGLEEVGWGPDREALIDVVWYKGSFQIAEAEARALLARGVEVLVVNGTPGMDAVRATGTSLPIVFVVVSNPVGAGYVPNLSRPGGNITGFSTFEPEMAGKWLQLLRELSPGMKHVNMLLDPKFTGFNSLLQAVTEIAPRHGIQPHAAHASSLQEIEAALATIAKQDAPGLIVSPSPVNTVNRRRLISIANEARIPAVYPFRFYIHEGALMAYGFSAADQFRRAAGYVSRILRGEKTGDLPVQAPSMFEFGINMKTAKQMGLTIPQALLISADEIIE
jgi:putative tryptophan/tyrosine transport system substrate-binding protein